MSAAVSGTDPHAAHSHFARFYEGEGALVKEVCDFADQALRVGGAAIIIAKAERLSKFERGLKGFGTHAGAGWYPGRLILLPAEATLEQITIDGRPDAARFNAVVGSVVAQAVAVGTPVHAFGEMVGVLCARGNYDAAIELERLWNELAKQQPFSLFCGYDAAAFRAEEHRHALKALCHAHDHVSPTESLAAVIPVTQLPAAVAALRHQVETLQAELASTRESENTLRHRERELRDFLENGAEGLHRVAGNGTILWANRAELELLGYAYDEYIGRHIAEFHADQPVIEGILATLCRGETLRDMPARLRCKDGSIKHVLIHSNGEFDENGKLLYTRCFTRDATEQVLARQERERLLADLKDASQAKDQFLAMLGHELRNPLAPIVTALQLMRMRGDTGTGREQAIIQRQLDHMIRLIDDLLDISRITRGKIELKNEEVKIGEVLTKAVEMVSLLLEQRRHELTVNADPGLLCGGDAVRLSQVVANLLSNAAHYTPQGGRVWLTARAAKDMIEIAVRDNGAGIAADQQTYIFNLFFQGPRNIDRSEGGLGIGLALVKNIVELHEGQVSVHSDGPGTGSVFTVRLPVRSGQSQERAAKPVAKTDAAQTAVCRVLLVDDNHDAVETLKLMLESYGHTVRTAYDPAAALEHLNDFLPEIAILDVGLPVMDGYELADEMRARLGKHACRFFALTGYGQDNDRARSSASGFEQHFVKPLMPDLIQQAIREPREI